MVRTWNRTLQFTLGFWLYRRNSPLASIRIFYVLQCTNITNFVLRNIVRPVLKLQVFVTRILSWLYLSFYQANIESWWLEKTLKQNSVFTQAELRTQFFTGHAIADMRKHEDMYNSSVRRYCYILVHNKVAAVFK